MRAGDVAAAVAPAVGEIDEGHVAARQHAGHAHGVDLESPPRRGQARDAHRFGAGFQAFAARFRSEDADIAPPHTQKPRGGHGCARAITVDEHDTRAAHGRVSLGRLDQLSARRVTASGDMSGPVFVGAAHVEEIERAAVGFAAPAGEGFGVDGAHAEPGGDARGGGLRPVAGGPGRRRRAPARAAFERKTRQRPAHRAVFQSDNSIRRAGVDQRLGADNRARPSGAVHDDERFRVGREVADAAHEFGPRRADGAGNVHAAIFVERAAVDDRGAPPGGKRGGEFGRSDSRRRALGLDDLAERLAGYVHAVEGFEPLGAPRRESAIEDPRVAIAEAGEPLSGAPGAVIGRAGVEERDKGPAPRNEPVDLQFDASQRERRGEQRMPTSMFADLAHVEQSDLAVRRPEPLLDRPRGDGLRHCRAPMLRLSTSFFARWRVARDTVPSGRA